MSPYRDAIGAQTEIARRRLAELRRERAEVELRYRAACADLETIAAQRPRAAPPRVVAAPQRTVSFGGIVKWALFSALVVDLLIALFTH